MSEAPTDVVDEPVTPDTTDHTVRRDCDACRVARALVTVVNDKDHDLELCGHHFEAFEVGLMSHGFTIARDERGNDK